MEHAAGIAPEGAAVVVSPVEGAEEASSAEVVDVDWLAAVALEGLAAGLCLQVRGRPEPAALPVRPFREGLSARMEP